MGRNYLFLLTLLILAACSGPAFAATKIFASETPAVTAPIKIIEPTKEPTKTPEPSPTPEKYLNLKPETWEKCMQENIVETDADFAQLMKKVKENPVDPTKVPFFDTAWCLYPPYNEKWEKTPQNVAVNEGSLDYWEGVVFDSCGAKKMADGKILPLIVLPIKRPGSEIVDHIAVAFDFEAQNKFAAAMKRGKIKDDWSMHYNNLKNLKMSVVQPVIILAPGNLPETNEIWKVPLSLIPTDPAKAKEYYQTLYQYFDFNTSYPDEVINKARSLFSSTILPVTFINLTW